MDDVFHGWRRKTGCVTLVAALIFLSGWVRSLSRFDVINCPLGNDFAIAIASWNDVLSIRVGWDNDDPWTEFCWFESDDDNYGFVDSKSPDYRFEQPIPDGAGRAVSWYLLGAQHGIGFSPLRQHSYCRMLFLIVPYSSIVVVLTGISACLVLIKPGRSRQKKTIDPVAAQGK